MTNFLANEIRFQKIKYGFRLQHERNKKLYNLIVGNFAMVAHYLKFSINNDLRILHPPINCKLNLPKKKILEKNQN